MKIKTAGDLLTESLRGCGLGISIFFVTLCAHALTKLSGKRKERKKERKEIQNVCEHAWHFAI